MKLFIIGFGDMGQALAAHAARIGHYPKGVKLSIVAIDPEANASKDAFLASIPLDKLRPLGVEFHFLSASAESAEARRLLVEAVADPKQIVTIAICIPAPDRSLNCALSLPREALDSDAPLLLRQSAPVSEECEALLKMLDPDIRIFGANDDYGLDSSLERLAEASHKIFREAKISDGKLDPEKKPSHREWKQIPAIKRLSNIYQTDAILERLAAWGYNLETVVAPGFKQSDEELRAMAESEHRRWWADYILAGYSFAPGDEDSVKRTHPCMRPFEELDKEIQRYDYDPVNNTPRLIADELKGKRA